MKIKQIPAQVTQSAKENSPAILTAAGLVGLGLTAFLTGKATARAVRLLDEDLAPGYIKPEFKTPQDAKRKLELVWTLYIPAVAVGALTASCIVGANRVGMRRAASMTAAFTLSERAFEEYKHKVVEKIGDKAEAGVREELSIERAKRVPVPPEYVYDDGVPGLPGSVLCFDEYSGRYFISDVESIKKAMNDTNYQINHHMHATLTDFYNKLGLPPNSSSGDIGWNSDELIEIDITTILTEDNQPCVAFDFVVRPRANYYNHH